MTSLQLITSCLSITSSIFSVIHTLARSWRRVKTFSHNLASSTQQAIICCCTILSRTQKKKGKNIFQLNNQNENPFCIECYEKTRSIESVIIFKLVIDLKSSFTSSIPMRYLGIKHFSLVISRHFIAY